MIRKYYKKLDEVKVDGDMEIWKLEKIEILNEVNFMQDKSDKLTVWFYHGNISTNTGYYNFKIHG